MAKRKTPVVDVNNPKPPKTLKQSLDYLVKLKARHDDMNTGIIPLGISRALRYVEEVKEGRRFLPRHSPYTADQFLGILRMLKEHYVVDIDFVTDERGVPDFDRLLKSADSHVRALSAVRKNIGEVDGNLPAVLAFQADPRAAFVAKDYADTPIGRMMGLILDYGTPSPKAEMVAWREAGRLLEGVLPSVLESAFRAINPAWNGTYGELSRLAVTTPNTVTEPLVTVGCVLHAPERMTHSVPNTSSVPDKQRTWIAGLLKQALLQATKHFEESVRSCEDSALQRAAMVPLVQMKRAAEGVCVDSPFTQTLLKDIGETMDVALKTYPHMALTAPIILTSASSPSATPPLSSPAPAGAVTIGALRASVGGLFKKAKGATLGETVKNTAASLADLAFHTVGLTPDRRKKIGRIFRRGGATPGSP